jgi:hypothetical protein
MSKKNNVLVNKSSLISPWACQVFCVRSMRPGNVIADSFGACFYLSFLGIVDTDLRSLVGCD